MKVAKKNGFVDLSDICDLEEAIGATPRIDEAKGVIFDVAMLVGNKPSKNKRQYLDSALNEAVSRYEGAKMFIDHPKTSEKKDTRSVRDLGGTYHNVRREGDTIKGDLHLLESQPIRDLIVPIAKARPRGVGLSIRDSGRVREGENGVTLVESFKPGATFSIDFVSDVSATKDLFESSYPNINEQEDTMKLSELKLEELQEANPGLCDALRNEGKTSVMKELEEAKAKGIDADKIMLKGKKLISLAEANLPLELKDSTMKIIEADSISLEEAVSIITAQKEFAAKAMKTAPVKKNAEPKVNGITGATVIEESAKELPSDEQIAKAFRG